MKAKLFLAALAVAAVAVPLATVAPAAASDVCLMHRDVDGWGARDNHSVVVNDRFGRKYLLSLSGLCSDINWAWGVGFRSIGGNFPGSCVERGDHVVMGGGGVSRMDARNSACWVTKVQRYTPEMEHADREAKANHQHLNSY